MKKKYRASKRFSEELKRKLVEEIDNCELSVAEVIRNYKVSETSVYRWLDKYSGIYKRKSRIVVEEQSESQRRKQLEKQVSELQRALGEKQMRLDYVEKLLELHKDQTGEDLKKKGE